MELEKACDRGPHGHRTQRRAIGYIMKQLELFEIMSGDNTSVQSILEDCHSVKCPDVKVRTLRRWCYIFIEWGEFPYLAKKRKQELDRLNPSIKINSEQLIELKKIVDSNPNLFLDEIALTFGIATGQCLHYSTIWRYMTKHLYYSQQMLNERVVQQREEAEIQFKPLLSIILQNCPERLVLVDDTHKDRNAACRRRGWAPRNAGGAKTRAWFKSSV